MSDVATEAEMAALFDQTDMPTWSLEDIFLPSNADWGKLANPHLVTLRVAALTVGKAKPDLLEMVKSFADDPDESNSSTALEEIVHNMIHTRSMFESWATLLDVAETRLMTAVAKVIQEGEDRQKDAQPC